eukprot:CAMPEP_0116874870 /NCGR_PEP_ID=MMETSP0463-20121206/6471_1 /TAXON_ID=181622 /ORGANISM="Strombidinopsis sp, Strain SopsisLIS2011" /LENGTH=46 /DNA_ID= /DNA_START= /DNA_END= /DNA_ORIENTATION=
MPAIWANNPATTQDVAAPPNETLLNLAVSQLGLGSQLAWAKELSTQ